MAHRYLYLSFTWFTENVSSCLFILLGCVGGGLLCSSEQEVCKVFCHEIERIWKQPEELCPMKHGLCIRGGSQLFGVSVAVWCRVNDEWCQVLLLFEKDHFQELFPGAWSYPKSCPWNSARLTLFIPWESGEGAFCWASSPRLCPGYDCTRICSVKVENQIMEPVAFRCWNAL